MSNAHGQRFKKFYQFILLLAPWVFLGGMIQVNFQKFLPYQRFFKGPEFFDYFTVTDIYITFLVALFVFGWMKRAFVKKLPIELVVCVGLVCLGGILQFVFQKVYEPVLTTPIEYFREFFVFPLIFTIILLRSEEHEIVARLVKSYIWMAVFFCAIALIQYLFGVFPGEQYDFTKRLVWPYVDFLTLKSSSANWVAFFVTPAFLLGFFGLVDTIKSRKFFIGVKLNKDVILYNTMTMLGALVIFLTQSYGAWAAAGTAIAFYFFRSLSFKKFLVVVCVMLAAAAGIFGLIQNSYKYRIMTGQQEYKYANSLVSRVDIYKMDLHMIVSNPLLGVGLNQFQSYFAQNQERVLGHKYPESQIPPHAHNFFAGMWINLGVFGFLGMLTLVLGIFWRNKFNPANPAVFVLLAIMMHGLIDSYYWRQEIAYTFWLIAALCYLYRVRKV